MPASVVQSAGTSGATTPANVTLGVAPTVGNTLLAVMASDTTHTGVPVAGAGRSYTQRLSQVGGMGFYVWTRLVTSGDSATTTFTPNGVNPASLQVIEIAGTYDKIGSGFTVVDSPLTSVIAPTVTPATADGIVIAIGGLHNHTAVLSSPTVNNSFTVLRGQFYPTSGISAPNVITASRVTSAATAVGATTIGWTIDARDRDAVQIAFTGIAAGGDDRTATGALGVTVSTGGTAEKAGTTAGAFGITTATGGTAAKGTAATGALGFATTTDGADAKASTAAGALPLFLVADGSALGSGSGTATGSLGISISLVGTAAKASTAAGVLGFGTVTAGATAKAGVTAGGLGLTFTLAGSASLTGGGDDRTVTGALSLAAGLAGAAAKASTAGGVLAFALATAGTAGKAAQSSGSLGVVLSMAGSTTGTGPYPDIRQPAATIRQRASAATIRDNQWKAELT